MYIRYFFKRLQVCFNSCPSHLVFKQDRHLIVCVRVAGVSHTMDTLLTLV